MSLLLVFLGSGIGGIARHLLVNAIDKTPAAFPLGILTVNIIASLLVGIITALLANHLPLAHHHRLLLVTGFCGGFSTFSAFTLQTLALWHQSHLNALLYILASVLLCLAATLAGLYLASKFTS